MEEPRRAAAALRIAFVIACVLIGEWVFPFLFGHRPWAFSLSILGILAFGYFSHRALHEKARDLGFRVDNFLHTARLLALPMLFGVIALALTGAGLGHPGFPWPNTGWHRSATFPWLVWWGLLQQYALQAIVNRQAQLIWGRGTRSILAVALVFAILHLPNVPLVIATFAGGVVWAFVYQRVPNLFALALSHAIMTAALVWALPASTLHGLRVGYFY